jgi:hypothetical protein
MPDAKTSVDPEDQEESDRDSRSLAINAARLTLYLSNRQPDDQSFVAIALARIAPHKELSFLVRIRPGTRLINRFL